MRRNKTGKIINGEMLYEGDAVEYFSDDGIMCKGEIKYYPEICSFMIVDHNYKYMVSSEDDDPVEGSAVIYRILDPKELYAKSPNRQARESWP